MFIHSEALNYFYCKMNMKKKIISIINLKFMDQQKQAGYPWGTGE